MNACEEYLDHIKGKIVRCALIIYEPFGGWNPTKLALPINYTDKELDLFIDRLNFEYDDGFGTQELHGTIWYEDGTWSERGEYDGSEWWEHRSQPNISPELLR